MAEAVVIVLGRWKGLLELERGVSLLETREVGWEEPLKAAIAETWPAILVEMDYPVYSAQVDYPADWAEAEVPKEPAAEMATLALVNWKVLLEQGDEAAGGVAEASENHLRSFA